MSQAPVLLYSFTCVALFRALFFMQQMNGVTWSDRDGQTNSATPV